MNTQVGTLSAPLSTRQHRIQAAIEMVLRAGGTRSELRDLVYQFADFSRIQGLPVEHATQLVSELGERAAPHIAARGFTAVGDSVADRVAMMARWCELRYKRAD